MSDDDLLAAWADIRDAEGEIGSLSSPEMFRYLYGASPTYPGVPGTENLPPEVRNRLNFFPSQGEGEAPPWGKQLQNEKNTEQGVIGEAPLGSPGPFEKPLLTPKELDLQKDYGPYFSKVNYLQEAPKAWNIMVKDIESGGRQFDPKTGGPLTSPAGAVGIAQVLPATGQETAAKHGIQWDPARFTNDAGYNETLGRLYFSDQLAKYHDPSLAAAAYNAGPGAVDEALRRASETGTSWFSHLPRETQAYVAKLEREEGKGVGNGNRVVGGTPPGGNVVGGAGLPGVVGTPGGSGMDFQTLLKAQLQMELLRQMFPQHTLTPVTYDPWAVQQGTPRPRKIDVNEGVA